MELDELQGPSQSKPFWEFRTAFHLGSQRWAGRVSPDQRLGSADRGFHHIPEVWELLEYPFHSSRESSALQNIPDRTSKSSFPHTMAGETEAG